MLNALIETKFYSPIPTGRLTARPRLDARLDESAQPGCRLLLVTAPAGFGKSTLVSAWLRQRGTPFAWLSLDAGDNEPRTFLSYLVGALQKVHPEIGANLQNRIATAGSADSEAVYADVLASLINEISSLPEALLLVMDDGHVLKNPQVLQLLNFLVDHLPAPLRLAVLTREDLPLPVGRLRVRRQVVEIRQADLQFTAEEAADFLSEGMGLRLSPANIAALEQRTEGWIAGLQLAALSMRYDPDPTRFIESFTGSDRYILAYLLEEVFAHQPREVQNFLLASSILSRFCAPLCDSVVKVLDESASVSSRAMLEMVEHSNLFLIPLDHRREWFRYHHLFSDLLRHSLEQTASDKIAALHLKASQWLESSGFIQEAARHAFQTRDWLYAAEMIERHAWNTLLHSQVSLVFEWCAAFPEAVIRKRPVLCVFHAWALVISFRLDNQPAAEARLQQAKAALADISADTCMDLLVGTPPVNLHAWVNGQITLLKSYMLMTAPRQQADPDRLIELGMQAFHLLPVEDITTRSAALLDVGYAVQARCEPDEAWQKFDDAITLAMSGGNFFGAVAGEYHRAQALMHKGKLREALEYSQKKKAEYSALFEQPYQQLPAIALLDQLMGCILLELNELDEAEQALRGGLEVGQWMPREEVPGYLALARLCAVKGDWTGHAEALRRLDMRWADIRYCTQAVRVASQLRAQPNDPTARAAAGDWAAAHVPDTSSSTPIPGIGPAWNAEADYAVYTAWIQIQILLGKPEDALAVIQPMLALYQAHNLIHRVIDLLLLQAQAHYSRGNRLQCWQSLMPALAHAEREGYLRLADQGPVLARLMAEAAEQKMAPRFIAALIGSGRADAETASAGHSPAAFAREGLGGLVEPLSAREVEVLELMDEGLSNIEIAARLYLSPNTLKSHTQNIYGKLEVHSRVQALNKARELKLIDR